MFSTVQEPTSVLSERGGGFDVFVRCEVITDHHGTGLQLRSQHLADVGCESLPIHCPFDDPGRNEALVVRPAIKVCVPHAPNGAFISNRSPRGQRPRNRVRLVLTEVSSMNTSLVGCARMAGMRCLNQPCRRRFTRERSLSAATSDFFYTCTPTYAESDRWRPHVRQRLWPPQAHRPARTT